MDADPGRTRRGKRRRWLWLLLLLPLIPVSPVLLFFGMATGTRILSMLTGPVNVWNSASKDPSPEELAGWYQLAETHSNDREAPGLFVSERSGFRLKANHALEIVDLPAFDGFGNSKACHFNGTGTWTLYGAPGQIQLNMNLLAMRPPDRGSLPSCGPENFSLFVLLGHSAPYRFWYYIGDPDEDRGILYKLRLPD